MKYLFFYIILLIFVSCSGKDRIPEGVIQFKEMQNILWDITRAQVLSAELARKDSTINEIAEIKVLDAKIFALHHISENDFTKTYNWYTNHPDILRNVFDSLSAQNQRENEKAIKQRATPVKFNAKKPNQKI